MNEAMFAYKREQQRGDGPAPAHSHHPPPLKQIFLYGIGGHLVESFHEQNNMKGGQRVTLLQEGLKNLQGPPLIRTTKEAEEMNHLIQLH